VSDKWFGTLLLLTEVEERPGDGFPKNSPEKLPEIFRAIFDRENRRRRSGKWSRFETN
jgi:hypothetical protein